MAGIGFELKKLFQKKGLFGLFRAYGYAGVITAGPMLLGALLLLGIIFLCDFWGTARIERELLVCMLTYTLLASLIVSSMFSMTVTRFTADMLYEEKKEMILPSFWGSNGMMLVFGGILYGLFLLISGISLTEGILCLWLFEEMLLIWNGMNYLTAIKEYRALMLSFMTAVAVSFLVGFLFLFFGIPAVKALMLAVIFGYGVMLVWDVHLLHASFPMERKPVFLFLQWLDRFFSLAFAGFLMNVGLFAHLVLMWYGPAGVCVKGLFYGAPAYDVPAFLAFFTILVTSINFVVSVEVHFYPYYRTYYSLFNDGGSIRDIQQAEKSMLRVLRIELFYLAMRQLMVSIISIALGTVVIERLPLGITDLMEGYFRILCVGYGLYAVGNSVFLMLLYFTDYGGALAAASVFAVSTIVGTLISFRFSVVYYGFGFFTGCALFFLFVVFRLEIFTRQLPYRILSVQPVVEMDRKKRFEKIGIFLEKQVGLGSTERNGRARKI